MIRSQRVSTTCASCYVQRLISRRRGYRAIPGFDREVVSLVPSHTPVLANDQVYRPSKVRRLPATTEGHPRRHPAKVHRGGESSRKGVDRFPGVSPLLHSTLYSADQQCQPLHHLCYQISGSCVYRHYQYVADLYAGCRHELHQQGRKGDWETRWIIMGPTCSLGIRQAAFVVIRDVRLGYLHVSSFLSS
jgi:hypothetical protein